LTRLDAAGRLGRLARSEAVLALIHALGDQEPRVRATAAESLGTQGALDAVIPLCQLLGDPRVEVRRAAATALGSLGDVQATASLIMALEAERDGETRRLMARALGEVGDRRALRPLQHLTGDKHWAVRREAAAAVQQVLARQVQS
jgi:HEAT repeat protein